MTLFGSGLTKNLPLHFRNAGFPCPTNENPAIYYISLATVDRESTERMLETQEQAIRLVEYHRENGCVDDLPEDEHNLFEMERVALCYLDKPKWSNNLMTLIGRSFLCIWSRPLLLFLTVMDLPLIALFITIFSSSLLSGAWTVPYAAVGTFQITCFLFFITTAVNTMFTYSAIRDLSFIEYGKGLYSQLLSMISYQIIVIPLNLVVLVVAGTVIFWINDILHVWLICRAIGVIWALCICSQAIVMSLMTIVKDEMIVLSASTSIITVMFVIGGGQLRSIGALSSSLVYLLSFASPFRYGNYWFSLCVMSRLPVKNCTRNEELEIENSGAADFCRWPNGSVLHHETYPHEFDPADETSNLIILLIVTLSYLTTMHIFHSIRKMRSVVKKFRFR